MNDLALLGGPALSADLQERAGRWPRVADATAARAAVLNVLDSGRWGRLHPNSNAEQLEAAFAAYQQARHGVAVTNGTVSLQLILRTLDIGVGDEVIVPGLTFIATASAVAEVGAVPIFADVDPVTLTIDPVSVAAVITPRTRAVIGVHYGGYPIDFDRVLPLVQERGLVLIEDAAHAQGTAWRGKRVGALGVFGSFSFQESKALPGGEGGMILTNDKGLAERARLLHSIGRRTDRADYLHFALASNYRLGEFQAAVLLDQMKRLPEQVTERDATGRLLDDALAQTGALLPQGPDERVTTRGYYFAVYRYQDQVLDGLPRAAFVAALRAEGVPVSAGYGVPVYRYQAFSPDALAHSPLRGVAGAPRYEDVNLPVTERVCAREQITIPHPLLLTGPEGVRSIAESVAKIVARRDDLHRWWRTQEEAGASAGTAPTG